MESLRRFDRWLRALGLQGGKPPEPAQTIAIGDESWLGRPFGRCGGEQDSAVGGPTVVVVFPPEGRELEVRAHFWSDGAIPELAYTRYFRNWELAGGAPPDMIPGTQWPHEITWSEGLPGASRVLSYECNTLAALGFPVDSSGNPDAFTFATGDLKNVAMWEDVVWCPVGPGQVLVYACTTSICRFGLWLRER